jgi:hypothetical protein
MPTPEAKEQTHREFYEAFHAWFMQSRVDFWSECDAPEELATIAVELSDRFAAQRGAEARDFGWVPEFLSDPPPPTEAALAGAELLSTLPLPEKRRLATEGEDATDQPATIAQTGGGDAGERARAFFTFEYMSTTTIEQRIKDVAAALRSSHREGTEAMLRCAHGTLLTNVCVPCLDQCGSNRRALPIPGKTDAG